MDYFIEIKQGTLLENSQDSKDCFKVIVLNGKKQISNIGSVSVHNGFGQTPQEAVRDFIRRNESNVLDEIFD